MAGPSSNYDFGRAPFEVPEDEDRHLRGWEPAHKLPYPDVRSSDQEAPGTLSYGPKGGDYKPQTYPMRDTSAADAGEAGEACESAIEDEEREADLTPIQGVLDTISGEYASNPDLLLSQDTPKPDPVFQQMQTRNPPLKTAFARLSLRHAALRRRALRRAAQEAARSLWVAVDLDGTILTEPVEDAAAGGLEPPFGHANQEARVAMQRLVQSGARVSVYTARFGDPQLSLDQIKALRQEIATWLDAEGVAYTDIWAGRKPRADAFIDDRAYRFEGDWGAILDQVLGSEAPDGVPDEEREATIMMGPRAGLTSDFLDQRPPRPEAWYSAKIGEVGPQEQFDPVGLVAYDKRRNYQ